MKSVDYAHRWPWRIPTDRSAQNKSHFSTKYDVKQFLLSSGRSSKSNKTGEKSFVWAKKTFSSHLFPGTNQNAQSFFCFVCLFCSTYSHRSYKNLPLASSSSSSSSATTSLLSSYFSPSNSSSSLFLSSPSTFTIEKSYMFLKHTA